MSGCGGDFEPEGGVADEAEGNVADESGGNVADLEASTVELGEAEQALNNGTKTSARPGVGWMNCSASIIHPRYALTARHCWPTADVVPAGIRFQFPDATGFVDNGNAPFRTVVRVKTLGPEDKPRPYPPSAAPPEFFNTDVLIARLDSAVPATATPSTLSSIPPLAGNQVTNFGLGPHRAAGVDCNPNPALGEELHKQFFTWNWGPGQHQMCPGDSGGPQVFGGVNGTGNIFGVNSFSPGSGDVFGAVWRYKEQILQIIRAWESTGEFEVGVDRPGMDITSFSSTSRESCRVSCINNSSCRAYTFTGSTCFLKSAVPEWSPTTCPTCTSGIRPTFESNIDRPGSDFLDMDLSASRADLCAAECATRDNCAAYTYAPAGVVTTNAHCWLKSSVPGAVVSALPLVSGVRASYEANVDRPGYDLSVVTAASAAVCKNTCAKNQDCLAFTYSGTTCRLKYAVPPPVVATGVQSGVRRGIDLFADRAGSDMAGSPFFVDPPFVEYCQTACEQSSTCKAYAFAFMPQAEEPEGPEDNDNAMCWLKSSIPAQTRLPTNVNYQRVFSGIKGLTFF